MNTKPTTTVLTVEPAIKPDPSICGECAHYEPYRDLRTNRVHPSRQGNCNWRPRIKWAMSAMERWGGQLHPPMVPIRGVWKNESAVNCETFERKQ